MAIISGSRSGVADGLGVGASGGGAEANVGDGCGVWVAASLGKG